MRLLGAILVGGKSRRFGSDKVEALVDGVTLLDRVARALRPQVDALVVAGREWPGLASVADWPEPGQGPLGGLAGALDHAERQGFDHVLSCGCDIPDLPPDLLAQLGSGPSIVDALPIVGLWPAALAPLLKDWMANSANRSVYRFANHIGARRVALHLPLTNVNHPEDLQ